MSVRRRRRSKRRFRRDRRGRFLPTVRRKRRRKGRARKRGRKKGGNPTGYPYSGGIYRPREGSKKRPRRPRYYRRRGAIWADVQTREAFYPGSGKPGSRRNPILQIVGYPLSRTGNPWGSVAQGFAMGVGADVAGRAMRKVWGNNPRRRRNPPRPGQKILSERAMTVSEARSFPGFLAAANGYRRFHGSAPSSVSLVRIADGQKAVTRRAVFAMGKAPEMTYKPLPGQKTNKAGATWVHKMGEHGGKAPLLVHDPKSGVTSFVGGTFRVADWVKH